MRMIMKNSYEELGKKIQDLRLAKGLNSQIELATLLKSVTQQSVSRWEKGSSRPRLKDLEALAVALGASAKELKELAGYSSRPIANISFDQPFPIDKLPPDTFERFCLFLLDQLHANAKVNRFGDTGHKQYGIDLEVLFQGNTYTYQCKRRKDFGPADIKKAVKAHTRVSQKKILLLTRIASAQARDEIKKHTDWELWDREDISLKIRQLPKIHQIRLVDIFFPGHRLPLLGETNAGPWMTVNDFFDSFLSNDSAFNHSWQLVGREKELELLDNHLLNPNTKVILLTGSGGSGKSRLLYQALKSFEVVKKDVRIWVLSVGEELTAKHLEDLGTEEKVLIVDDAHDRASPIRKLE